jgi:large subunit ribosomal protein L10
MLKQEKLDDVEKIKRLMDSHSVVGVLNMHKLPARQLQEIRHSIGAKIKMSKRSLILRAIEGSSKKDIKNLKEKIEGPSALLFTNENPFRLFRILKENRSPAAAKTGDIPNKDIVIQKGSTGLPPGPAISTLTKIGLKASVQNGKIAVLQDKVVTKAGQAITEDVAAVLGLLKVEPLEIGLDLSFVYEDGMIYDRSVLDISTEAYIEDFQRCVQHGVNLSVNTNYPTKQTIDIMIQKTFIEAKAVCVEANILEKDFIDDVLKKAIRQAVAMEKQLGIGQ